MGYRNREIESKLIASTSDLHAVNNLLATLFRNETKKMLFGSSVDTYWTVPDKRADADFIRIRERDGIRQITVKGKDKGTNLDRLEIDIDSTSPFDTIYKLVQSMYGDPIGKIAKTYYVYWLNKTDTVCCYTVTEPAFERVIIEVEASSNSKMLELEAKVLRELGELGIMGERAPGSLYEMMLESR